MSDTRNPAGPVTVEDQFYRVDLNDDLSNLQRSETKKYCPTNVVRTSKYTSISFVPLTLYEFFRIVANQYFLVISLFQLFTDLNPENSRYTTVGPLLMVLLVTQFRQAYEDSKRHKADREMNARKVLRVARSGKVETIFWNQVRMGDILKVRDREEFPADCVILGSSEKDGKCFTETANLDGETNLKRRIALTETSDFIHAKGGQSDEQQASVVTDIAGYVEYEKPNNRLYNFEGRVVLQSAPDKPVPIFPDNVILRGCMLRSCQYVYGCVVFIGAETKLMKNMRPAPLKQSNVYKMVNQCVLLIFGVQLIMMIYSAVEFAGWNYNNPSAPERYATDYASDAAELNLTSFQKFSNAFLSLFTFLMLYANLVPISLYVSMDIIKVAQARLIEKDEAMIYKGTAARARTSDLNEDLGQIEYVFSDKTGTLTCNMMEFRKCYIGGVAYGFGTTEIGRAAAALRGLESAVSTIDEEEDFSHMSNKKKAQVIYDDTINFDDPRLIENLRANNDKTEGVNEFLTLLSVCHTVIPEMDHITGKAAYRAASPDEEALVKAAKCLGFNLKTAAPIVEVEVVAKNPDKPKTMKYEILAVNEFTSTRKRMSSLVKAPNGDYILYSKGADNVMFERSVPAKYQAHMEQKLKDFASEGLRTLVCCKRVIPAGEAKEWLKEYHDAMSALVGRDELLVKAGEKIEKHLVVVGCTAIEDKLQDGVPAAIVNMANARIKLWVLTGDKVETAINIAFACGLINQKMKREVVTAEGAANADIIGQLQRIQVENKIITKDVKSSDTLDMAMVVDGACLTKIMADKTLQDLFLSICRVCKAVVACRVSPAQKAQIVSMVRTGITPEPITLSIGDGANDVNMIQTAHVGIGISGQEGVQAVNASDYAISQFRFLENLLLVHGRNNYRNLSVCILYSFYKNIALITTLFLFNYENGQSGSTLYESMIKIGWNVFLALPICVLGVYDREVSDEAGLKNPILYTPGQANEFFNRQKFAIWSLNGIFHGLIAFLLPIVYIGVVSWSQKGHTDGYIFMGTTVYTAILSVMNIKVALMVKTWNWTFFAIWLASIVSYFVFIAMYSSVFPFNSFYDIAFRMFESPMFYALNILIPVTCLMSDIAILYMRDNWYPSPVVILRERVKYDIDEDRKQSRANLLAARSSSGDTIKVESTNPHKKVLMTDTVNPALNIADYSGFAYNSPDGIEPKRRVSLVDSVKTRL